MQSSAYGASLAGGTFDLESFVKQPQTIVRCLSWVSDLLASYTETLASEFLPAVTSLYVNRCELPEWTLIS